MLSLYQKKYKSNASEAKLQPKSEDGKRSCKLNKKGLEKKIRLKKIVVFEKPFPVNSYTVPQIELALIAHKNCASSE